MTTIIFIYTNLNIMQKDACIYDKEVKKTDTKFRFLRGKRYVCRQV